MPGFDTAYAPFVTTHEDRLVCSLVSESGLSPAAARAVAADVLPVAYTRSFASDGAAYGWLRVAARHHAAGSPGWADAADAALAALGQDRAAAAALAGLSAADRELLRLRYVEGLLPAALAAKLGVAEAEVRARLDRARGTATRSLTRPRTLAVPLPRAAAALAAAAAAAFVSFGGGVSPGSPPAVARRAPTPYADTAIPQPTVPVGAEEPAAANGRVAVQRPLAGVPGRPVPVSPPHRPGPDGEGPGGRCRTGCRPPTVITDELHIHVPSELADVVGQKEVVVEQQVAEDVVSVCETVPAIPAGVASCVPARH